MALRPRGVGEILDVRQCPHQRQHREDDEQGRGQRERSGPPGHRPPLPAGQEVQRARSAALVGVDRLQRPQAQHPFGAQALGPGARSPQQRVELVPVGCPPRRKGGILHAVAPGDFVLDDRLAIATPEGVELELTLAGLGSRAIAGGVDLAVKGVLIGLLALALLATGILGLTLLVPVIVIVMLGYDVAFETLAQGRTPGKRRTGLRVVREGGGPVDVTALVPGAARAAAPRRPRAAVRAARRGPAPAGRRRRRGRRGGLPRAAGQREGPPQRVGRHPWSSTSTAASA